MRMLLSCLIVMAGKEPVIFESIWNSIGKRRQATFKSRIVKVHERKSQGKN